MPESTNERTPREVAAGLPATSSLHLVLKFHQSGGVDFVSANELPGRSVVSDAAVGDYLIEVVAGGRMLAVHGIPDPFEVHGFGGPDLPHHEERAAEATLTVRVPGIGLTSAEVETLEVRLLRAKTGGEAIGRLSVETLGDLRQAGKLETIASAPAGSLTRAIREQGTRADE